jgi:UDP-glucose 4-epimerase
VKQIVHLMTALKNSTAAVTGGCGFIGSHLIQRLRLEGVHVLAIDSLDYGSRESLDTSDPNIQFEKLQLRTGSRPQLVEMLNGVDYVFHLAAEKHNQSINSPGLVLDANIMGTYELLSAAADAGVKKVVFTSSLYAYGRMCGPPLSEDDVATPHTVYGISKLTGEHLCRYFSLQRGLPAVCLRLFFVYGPRQYSDVGYKSVIVRNFDRILQGQRPLINGDGNQEFDYIYVDDVVSAILSALSSDEKWDLFNVGSGLGVSINRLTELMMEVAGITTVCEYGPPDLTHGSSRVARTKKFYDSFGYKPKVSLPDGLQRTLDWVRSYYRQNA